VVAGADPARDKKARQQAETLAQLCDLYLAEAREGRLLTRRRLPKKMSTLYTDELRIARHIKPLLGNLKVTSVQQEDVERFLYQVATGETAAAARHGYERSRARGGMGTASRTTGLLGAIFTFAIKRRIRADNPVRGVERPADRKRDRRLSDDEYAALGRALREAKSKRVWPFSIAAARFLALTGWRAGEVLGLRWKELDVTRRTAVLADSKSGRSMRPLSYAACETLAPARSGELVFPAPRARGPAPGFTETFRRIARLGALPDDITPHTLRHSFASLAADLGYSEPTIAALIGHKGLTMTSRYVHSADAVLLAAADAVAARTAELMGEVQVAEVVPLRVAG
jgi:integrase